MSMCRIIFLVIGKGCLLWLAYSLDKTLLAFALLHLYCKVKPACYSGDVLTCTIFIQVPYDEKIFFFFFMVLALEGVIGLHRAIQLQLLWHQWLGQRLGLLWHWMVCPGNKGRSFCCFWDCTQVLHFGVFYWLWGLLHFLSGILATVVHIMIIWIKYTHSHPF